MTPAEHPTLAQIRAAIEADRCFRGDHDWRTMTTARQGFVRFQRCVRGCGASRTQKGTGW